MMYIRIVSLYQILSTSSVFHKMGKTGNSLASWLLLAPPEWWKAVLNYTHDVLTLLNSEDYKNNSTYLACFQPVMGK